MYHTIEKRKNLSKDIQCLTFYVTGKNGESLAIPALIGTLDYDIIMVREGGKITSLPSSLENEVNSFLQNECHIMKL